MVDSLPGGIDDSASYVYNPLKHKSDADLMGQAAAIQEELQKRQATAKVAADKARFPITHKRSLYSGKEDNWNEAKDELKLSEEAQRTYAYTGMEVELTCIVGEDGTCRVTHLNEVALLEPVEI